MKQIQSKDNPFFKELVKLSSSVRQRDSAKQTLLDGAHLLASYLDCGYFPQHIMLNTTASQNDEIAGLIERLGDVAITLLDDKLFAAISGLKTPSGILSLIAIPDADKAAGSHFALLLEDIQDPGNLGSILRTAAAAGCDTLFLSGNCADVWSPKVLRAAMGGHFVLRIHERQDLLEVAKGFSGKLLATSLQAKNNLYDCDLHGDIAFLIGNEGAGLSGELMQLASHHITIPMRNQVESLNAATATAICLFEAVRQRMQR